MGLVTRSRSETSNREVVVALSAKGRALVQTPDPDRQEAGAKASAGLSAKELAAEARWPDVRESRERAVTALRHVCPEPWRYGRRRRATIVCRP